MWNYDLATAYLFGGLARQMRELEYQYATADDGGMSFRILLPLDQARDYPLTAADGQFGCVVKLFREWQLSGDDDWLREVVAGLPALDRVRLDRGRLGRRPGRRWPRAPSTTRWTWSTTARPRSSRAGTWPRWRAAAQLAEAAGDPEFAATCRSVLASGQRLTEEQLFNGRVLRAAGDPARRLQQGRAPAAVGRHGRPGSDQPEFQIGDGCLTDQLLGDIYAQLTGIGPVFDQAHAATTLDSIHRLNYVPDFGAWTNYMRTYAVHGERGHIVMSYPKGLPEHPMPYWPEVWTGLEYVYAIGLIQHGQAGLAEDAVAAARERFSGRRRNPFDEAECGHHYARAMASWGLVVALTGFRYDARQGLMTFAEVTQPTRWFWSTGSAWGTVQQTPGGPDAAGSSWRCCPARSGSSS